METTKDIIIKELEKRAKDHEIKYNELMHYEAVDSAREEKGAYQALRAALNFIYSVRDTTLAEKKAYLQEHCNHDWGGVEWTWSCGGYRTCRICGKTEDYYERD